MKTRILVYSGLVALLGLTAITFWRMERAEEKSMSEFEALRRVLDPHGRGSTNLLDLVSSLMPKGSSKDSVLAFIRTVDSRERLFTKSVDFPTLRPDVEVVRLNLQHKYEKDGFFIFHIMFAFSKIDGLKSIGLYSSSGSTLSVPSKDSHD